VYNFSVTGADYKNELFRDLRKQKGLTMEEVGQRVGKTRMMIHYAESGKRCSDKLLKKLCNLYELPLKEIFREGPALTTFLPETVKTS
jgi:transcriptional regulator with XRE-family HTH domain